MLACADRDVPAVLVETPTAAIAAETPTSATLPPTQTPVPAQPKSDPPTSVPTPGSGPILPTPTAPPQASQSAQEVDLGPEFQALDALTQQLRGLEAIRPVKKRVIDREQLRVELLEELEEDREFIEREQLLLSTLGAIEDDDDLFEILMGLYGGGVLGFYDPEEEEFTIVQSDEERRVTDLTTYVHEFVHNLQQQHFDIHALGEEREENTDMGFALSALIEGDAELAQAAYIVGFLDDEQRRSLVQEFMSFDLSFLAGAPEVILEQFGFPYVEGADFVEQVFDTGGRAAVDAAFADPPVSTEQVLHPEKYMAGEVALTVALPDVAAALGDERTELFRDTVGEFLIRVILDLELSSTRASTVAAGWGGDSIALHSDTTGRVLAVWVIAWDDSNEAQEFADAFVSHVERRSEETWRGVEGDPDILTIASGDQAVALRVEGDETVIVYAPDHDLSVEALRATGSLTRDAVPGAGAVELSPPGGRASTPL